jgi:hypothetical protein
MLITKNTTSHSFENRCTIAMATFAFPLHFADCRVQRENNVSVVAKNRVYENGTAVKLMSTLVWSLKKNILCNMKCSRPPKII